MEMYYSKLRDKPLRANEEIYRLTTNVSATDYDLMVAAATKARVFHRGEPSPSKWARRILLWALDNPTQLPSGLVVNFASDTREPMPW